MSIRIALIILAVCLCQPALTQDAGKKKASLPKAELIRLVKDLSDSSFKLRRAALKEAMKLAPAAKKQLAAELRKSKDPELRFAAEKIAPSLNVTGDWNTEYGVLRLKQDGFKITGTYDSRGTVVGKLEGRKLVFTYHESGTNGSGWFLFDKDSFKGKWRTDNGSGSGEWSGTRNAK